MNDKHTKLDSSAIRTLFLTVIIMMSLFTLSGCYTFEGLVKDVQTFGDGMGEVADDIRD